MPAKGKELKNWLPEQSQEYALKYAKERDFDYVINDLAEELGISRQAIWNWNKTPAFMRWWKKEREIHFKSLLDRVHAKAFQRATGKGAGNVQDAKLFMERFDPDYIPASRKEISGADGGPVKAYISLDIDDVIGAQKEAEDDGEG